MAKSMNNDKPFSNRMNIYNTFIKAELNLKYQTDNLFFATKI